jgi:hypothetical protein
MMKQSEIKARRHYRNTTSGVIRFVLEKDTDDFDVGYVVWRTTDTDSNKKTSEEDQPIESFAEWADEEVMPIFDAVMRCPKCDEWDWWAHAHDGRATCDNCDTVWDPIHGKVIENGND